MLSRVTMLVSTSVSAAVKSAAFAAEKLVHWHCWLHKQQRGSQLQQVGAQPRRRTQVQDIYQQSGPLYFRRANWMKYHLFKKLVRKLHNDIVQASGKNLFAGTNYRYVLNGNDVSPPCGITPEHIA
jgi:hypothetical protein